MRDVRVTGGHARRAGEKKSLVLPLLRVARDVDRRGGHNDSARMAIIRSAGDSGAAHRLESISASWASTAVIFQTSAVMWVQPRCLAASSRCQPATNQ